MSPPLFNSFWRCIFINKQELLINEKIRDKEVRVIGAEGEQLGIMPSKDAYKIALNRNLDLVKVAPAANPPVCRIMDYGKYVFEQAKREKEARRNQKIISIKEVQLGLKIDSHDLETKINHANRFLKDGDKVKVVLKFRGRELAHTSLGNALLDKFCAGCEELGVVEKPAKLEGHNMIMFLAAKKETAKPAAEAKKQAGGEENAKDQNS